MSRATTYALALVLCVSAASAQAAAPKGKFGIHKPVGVTKASGTNVGVSGGIGNVTNPIVNTPPKVPPHRFPINTKPIAFPPPSKGPGPIDGMPVAPTPKPTCGCHKGCDHYCHYSHYCHCDGCLEFVPMMYVEGCTGYVADDASEDMSDDMDQ